MCSLLASARSTREMSLLGPFLEPAHDPSSSSNTVTDDAQFQPVGYFENFDPGACAHAQPVPHFRRQHDLTFGGDQECRLMGFFAEQTSVISARLPGKSSIDLRYDDGSGWKFLLNPRRSRTPAQPSDLARSRASGRRHR